MAFALIFIGLMLVVSAVRGSYSQLFKLVKSDFTGPGNFVYWTAIVLLIGSIGYIKPLQTLSRAFLGIIILVLLLTKGNPNNTGGGFFSQLLSQVGAGTSANTNPAPVSTASALAPLDTVAPLISV